MDERIQRIVEKWAFSEEALFSIIYEHDIEPNERMLCPFRCGKGKVEYSPSLIAQLSDAELELCLEAEAIRILMKHPYERQPVGCKRSAMSIGSNLVLSDNYDFSEIGFKKPADYSLPEHESYEFYTHKIDDMGDDVTNPDEDDISNQAGGSNQSGGGSGGGGTNGGGSGGGAGQSGQSGSANGGTSQPGKGGGKDEDYYILTLADGTTLRMPKGNAKATRGGGASQTSAGSSTSQTSRTVNTSTGGASQTSAGGAAQNTQNYANSGATQNSNQTQSAQTHKFNFHQGYSDLSQLWEEDEFRAANIDRIIEDTKSWGNIPGNVVQQIKANVKVKVDYRKVLSGFRASVISSKRHLTRMRPSRRSGFDNLGSIRNFVSRILVAVDVSGSLSDQSIQRFYSAINRMFKYGIEKIDIIQFDCALGEVQTFKKKFRRAEIKGRGGTSYQPIFAYIMEHPEYDGLVIYTDGYAERPVLPKKPRTKIAWVCSNMNTYDEHHLWMQKFGRCCALEF